MEHRCNDPDRANRNTGRKTYPIVTSFTTKPIWTSLSSNPNLYGGRSANNRVKAPRNLKARLNGVKYPVRTAQ